MQKLSFFCKKAFTIATIGGIILTVDAKEVSSLYLWKKKCKHFNIKCIYYICIRDIVKLFFYFEKKIKKVKKIVDIVEYICYIINALEKKDAKKKKFFENWAKCQFE